MRRTLILALLPALLLGCARRHMGTNNLPLVVDQQELQTVRQMVATYRASGYTLEERNALMERVAGISDDHYLRLRTRLLGARNASGFAAEVAGTTISAVAALLGDADVKSMLSTAAVLTQSTKISIDKNFFASLSTQALLSKMDELRAGQRRQLLASEQLGLEDYSLETACNDLRQYDAAGTLAAGLVALAEDAARSNGAAQDALRGALKARRVQP